MKMHRHEVSQIVMPTQVAYHLRVRPFRKFPTRFHTQSQEIGSYLDQQGRVQAISLQLHRANREERFEHLPEICSEMLLLPDMPDFCTSHRHLTAMHQRVAAGGAFAKKEEHQRSKGGAMSSDATRRDIHPPLRIIQNQCFFPLRSVLLLIANCQGIIAFARHDDFGTSSTMQP